MIKQVNVREVRDDMKRRYQSVGVTTGLTFYDWVARMFPKNLYAVEEDRPKRILPVPVLAESSRARECNISHSVAPTGEPKADADRQARGSATGAAVEAHAFRGADTDSRGGQKPFDRKAYMKDYMEDYRKKPVVCPNCGHTFKELKRVKE